MSNITERLKAVIESETDPKRRFKDLEGLTGINAESWKAAWHGKQKPTLDMVERTAQLWPDYGYWIATGLTEPKTGHVAPSSYEPRYPVMRGTPEPWRTKERLYLMGLLKEQPTEEAALNARSTQLEELAFNLRESYLTPGIYLNFERVMKALREPVKPEMLLLETDEELLDISEQADKATIATLQEIGKHRANSKPNLAFEKAGAKAKKAFRKILNMFKTDDQQEH